MVLSPTDALQNVSVVFIMFGMYCQHMSYHYKNRVKIKCLFNVTTVGPSSGLKFSVLSHAASSTKLNGFHCTVLTTMKIKMFFFSELVHLSHADFFVEICISIDKMVLSFLLFRCQTTQLFYLFLFHNNFVMGTLRQLVGTFFFYS